VTTLASDIPEIDLAEEVRKLVAQVPEGKITSYGKVAEALGDIVASRFVGKVMSENDDIVRVPCRRVVQSDGRLGGFTGGGTPAKKKALQKEGIEIIGDRIVDFEDRLFNDFKTDYPLRKFREIQIRDSKKLKLNDDFDDSLIAGSDIAYDGDRAYGVLVIFDKGNPEPAKKITLGTKVSFPYIPTYLTFREAEVVKKLFERIDEKPLLIYDGNGILHPLGFGIASHIGVMLDTPTIGVAKKLLCGTVAGKGDTRKVFSKNKHIGYAISGKGWSSPVYVSPGHRITASSSLRVLRSYWEHRVPEPIRLAHISAEQERRNRK